MDLYPRCKPLAIELNETEGWHLSPQAIEDFVRAVLPFVNDDMSEAELRQVVLSFYLDSPRVERMKIRGDPEGEADWEAVREHFVVRARRLGIPYNDAEDVAQDACRKATEKLSTYRFQNRLERWLSVIIRNECWQRFRIPKAKPIELPLDALASGEESQDVQNDILGIYRRVSAADTLEPRAETPESLLLNEERVAAIDQVVKQLRSGKYIKILWYLYQETHHMTSDGRPVKWTDAEIAKEVGLAPGSIAKTRERILSRLRDDPSFRQLVGDLFGTDWLMDRKLTKKERVRTRAVRASKKIDAEKEQ